MGSEDNHYGQSKAKIAKDATDQCLGTTDQRLGTAMVQCDTIAGWAGAWWPGPHLVAPGLVGRFNQESASSGKFVVLWQVQGQAKKSVPVSQDPGTDTAVAELETATPLCSSVGLKGDG